jgi:ribonuclease E
MTGPQNRGEDDSWGKLANELLGINLGAEEDLDLSDLEPPPLEAPPPAPQPAATPAAEAIDLSEMDFEADVEEEEEEKPIVAAAAEVEPAIEGEEVASEPAATAEADDFWDVLESWDWETSEEGAKAAKDSERGSRRPDRRGMESRGGKRESREERPPRGEVERTRPARREESPRREVPRSSLPSRPAPVADEFGAGLLEEVEESSWGPTTERARPSLPHDVIEPAGELVEEEDEPEFGVEAEREGEGLKEEGAPRRRRRRRRRRGGERREKRPELLEDVDELASPVEEELSVESAESVEEEWEAERRGGRRRRRRRRPEGSPPPATTEEPEMSEQIELPEEDGSATEEEEDALVRPMSYENVPTWEEAISYLLRPRGERPRRR